MSDYISKKDQKAFRDSQNQRLRQLMTYDADPEQLVLPGFSSPVLTAEVSSNSSLTLPTDSTARKGFPLLTGCLNYFPAALAGVAQVSKAGNDKHNPGKAMHHARSKSTDQGDCILRHLMDVEGLIVAHTRGEGITKDAILLEANQMAWRALAYSQLLHESLGAPVAPGAEE